MALVQSLASGNVMTNSGPSSRVELPAQVPCPSSASEPAQPQHQQQQQQHQQHQHQHHQQHQHQQHQHQQHQHQQQQHQQHQHPQQQHQQHQHQQQQHQQQQHQQQGAQDEMEEEVEEEPEVDIIINNVVCSFSVCCQLDLRYIAMNGDNVEYRRDNGMVTMKLRKPYTTASMWSSGKITCTGTTSEPEAKVAARRVARYLQKQLNYQTRLSNFRVVNVLGTCTMPFAIKIADFSQKYPRLACYEPELHPGVTFRIKEIKATLKVFSTGSVTVTAPSVAAVQSAIEHIFPLVNEFRKEKTATDLASVATTRARRYPSRNSSDSEDSDSA